MLPKQLLCARTGPEKFVIQRFRIVYFVPGVSFPSNCLANYSTSIYNFSKPGNSTTDISQLAEASSKPVLVC